MYSYFKIKQHEEFVYDSEEIQFTTFQIELSKELEDLMGIQRILNSLNDNNIDQSAQKIESYRDVSKLALSRNLVRYSIIRRNSKIYLDLISKLKNFERLSDIENIIDDYVKQDFPICEAFRKISCKTEESEIRSIIRSDDVASLQSLVDSSHGFDFEQIIYLDHEESFMLRRQCIKCVQLLPYSMLCGSVKCFKYLLLNGSKLNKFQYIPAAAIYGQSIEIVRILEQNGFDFTKSLDSAIVSHNEEIFEWILTKNPSCLDELNLNISVQHEFIYGLSRFSSINGQRLFDDAIINIIYEFAFLAMNNCMIDPRQAIFDSLKKGTLFAKEFSNLPDFKCNFKLDNESFIYKVLKCNYNDFARELIIKYQRCMILSPDSFFLVVKMHEIELTKVALSMMNENDLIVSLSLILGIKLNEEEEKLIFNPHIKEKCVSCIEEGYLGNLLFLEYCFKLSEYRITKLGRILCAIASKCSCKKMKFIIEYLNNSPLGFIEQVDIGDENIINCAITSRKSECHLEKFIEVLFKLPKIEENITKGCDPLLLYSLEFGSFPKDKVFYEHLDPSRVTKHPKFKYLTFPIFEFFLLLDSSDFNCLDKLRLFNAVAIFDEINDFCMQEEFKVCFIAYLIKKHPNCLKININGRTLFKLVETLLGGFDKCRQLEVLLKTFPGQEIFYHDELKIDIETIIENHNKQDIKYHLYGPTLKHVKNYFFNP